MSDTYGRDEGGNHLSLAGFHKFKVHELEVFEI